MVKERQRASFDPRTLTHFLDGGEKQTKVGEADAVVATVSPVA